MNQPRLTAVIIAHQAERTITTCVQALHFCDRIIVGEHQSPDQTANLARAAGAEVVAVTWQGYGKTKNQLLSLVKTGWILSLDADEVATPELGQEIPQVMGQDPGLAAFWISRRNYFLGKEIRYCGWRPDWQLRLFRAGQGAFAERRVHEALQVEGSKGYLKAVVNHYSYASVADYLSRLNCYTSLAAQERQERGKRFNLLGLILDPPWTFFKMYLLKSGWRDGFPGFALCSLSSLNTLVKHAKQWELENFV